MNTGEWLGGNKAFGATSMGVVRLATVRGYLVGMSVRRKPGLPRSPILALVSQAARVYAACKGGEGGGSAVVRWSLHRSSFRWSDMGVARAGWGARGGGGQRCSWGLVAGSGDEISEGLYARPLRPEGVWTTDYVYLQLTARIPALRLWYLSASVCIDRLTRRFIVLFSRAKPGSLGDAMNRKCGSLSQTPTEY